MKKSVLFWSLIMSFSMLGAQSTWEGGLFAGFAVYSGDVNPSLTPRFKDLTPSLGLNARTNLTKRFGFRTGLTYFKLKGDDDNYPERESRDFDFNTNLLELSILGEWEPFGSNRFYTDAGGDVNMDKLISPYLYAGVSLFGGALNTSFSNYNGSNEVILSGISKDKAYGNSLIGVSIPLGVGVRLDLSEGFALAVEGGMRAGFSDYLDGISFSASPDAKDIYMNLGLVIYRRFGNLRNER